MSNKESIDNKKILDKKILVLSGGGVKGLAHIGALCAYNVKSHNLTNIEIFAGTSVGALIASLLVIGYTPQDLYDFVMAFDLRKFGNIGFKNLLNMYGLDDGTHLIVILQKMFENKGFNKEITFKELFEKTKKQLIINSCCINEKQTYLFSVNNTPEMNVIKALRMSASVPIYYAPVEHNNNLFVDGGCMDNYLIHLFRDRINEVIGIYIHDVPEKINNINNLEDTLMHIYQSMNESICNYAIKDYEKYSVIIKISNISLMELDLNKTKKKELINIGYNAFTEQLH